MSTRPVAGIPAPAARFVDPTLEAQVLRALAGAGEETFYRLVDLLPPAAFAVHRDAYARLAADFDAGRSPDPGALPEADLPAGFNLEAGARQLADLARKRLAAEAVARFWADLAGGMEAGEAIARAQEALAEADRAVRELAPGQVVGMESLLDQAVAVAAEVARLRAETGRPSPHPSLGPELPQVTRMFGGFVPGVWALGGEPGVGKTFLSLYWAHRYLAAEMSTGVVWVDCCETRPLTLLALRFACIHARINPHVHERGSGNPQELVRAAQAVARLAPRFYVVDATEHTTVAHIRAAVRRLQAQRGVTRVMVVVDYVQKLAQYNAGGGAVDLRQRVMYAVASLTRLVEVSSGPIILISALAKDAYRRQVRDASLSDFREAGDVEYTADIGLQLRKADDQRNHDASSAVRVLDLWVLKNRFGSDGTVRLYQNRAEASFSETDPGYVLLPGVD